MPAAAVIPAPIAYIKVVAVKKLVVGSQVQAGGPARAGHCPCRSLPRSVPCLVLLPQGSVGAVRGCVLRVDSRPRRLCVLRVSVTPPLSLGCDGSGSSARSPGGGPWSPALPLPAPLPAVLFAERPGRPASLL